MRSSGTAPHAAQVELIRVPGAFEMPVVTCKRVLAARRHDAVIALGAVIRGETPHFDYVAGECARGISRSRLQSGVPIAFGVLTTDTLRTGDRSRRHQDDGNKGAEAAVTAIEMANLLRRLDAEGQPR